MDEHSFDEVARNVGNQAGSRRRMLLGLIGVATGFSLGVSWTDADASGRCPGNQKQCRAGCCKRRFPVCCNRNRYCCKRGTFCCNTPAGLGCCR